MALSKNSKLVSVQVHPAADADADAATSNQAHPWVHVTTQHNYTDSSDESANAVSNSAKTIYKLNIDAEGTVVGDTDYSGEDALVVSICDAIWS